MTVDSNYYSDSEERKLRLLKWYPTPGTTYVNLAWVLRPKDATIEAVERTKIIATVSGSWLELEDQDFIETVQSFNVLRFNLSHIRDEKTRDELLQFLKRLEKFDLDIPVLWDLQGPELRTLVNKDPETPIHIEAWDLIRILVDKEWNKKNIQWEMPWSHHVLYINRDELLLSVDKGDEITIDDGTWWISVIGSTDQSITAQALNSFNLGSRKSINFRWEIDMETVTQSDKSDIDELINPNIREGDIIAPSFVKHGEDLNQIASLVSLEFKRYAMMPKIECRQAIRNLQSIIELAKYICAARWDGRMEIGEDPAEWLILLEQMLHTSSVSWVTTVIATWIAESLNNRYAPQTADLDAIAAHLMKLHVDFLWFSSETVPWFWAKKISELVVYAKRSRVNMLMNAPTEER